MTQVTFKRISPEEARIYQGDEHVGDVYRLDDIVHPGSSYFEIHLIEDPRGPRRVKERSRIRGVAQRLLDTHPYFG